MSFLKAKQRVATLLRSDKKSGNAAWPDPGPSQLSTQSEKNLVERQDGEVTREKLGTSTKSDELSIPEPHIPAPSRQTTIPSSLSEYQYEKIDKDQIRLLTLLPAASADDTVECMLTHYQRSENASYTAISYTWGQRSLDSIIMVNEKALLVTKSCAAALRALRPQDNVLTVWIDAVCINQFDFEERSTQVARMGDVFRRAEETVAHLDLENGITNPESPSMDMPKHAWWVRTWVIQEVMFSRRIDIIMGGNRLPLSVINLQFELSDVDPPPLIRLRNDLVHEYGMRPLDSWGIAGREPNAENQDNVIDDDDGDDDVMRAIDSARVRNTGLSAKVPLMPPRVEGTATKESGEMNLNYWMLPQLMDQTRHFQCYDPLDKLYAILPLFRQPIPSSLRPNYNSTMKDVFSDLSWFFIQETLPDCLTYINGDVDSELPSWVTDWRREASIYRTEILRMSKSDSNEARAGFQQGQREIHATRLDQDRIVLRGRLVATVEQFFMCKTFLVEWTDGREGPLYKVTIALNRGTSTTGASLQGWIQRTMLPTDGQYSALLRLRGQSRSDLLIKHALRNVLKAMSSSNTFREADWPRDELTRTCYFSSVRSFADGTVALGRAGQLMQAQLSRMQPKDKSVLHRVTATYHEGPQYQATMTKQALTGDAIVPETVKIGDQICVLLGFQMPFLIRRAGDHWRLLGECIVAGNIWNGAAVDDLDWSTVWSNSPDPRLEDFVIV